MKNMRLYLFLLAVMSMGAIVEAHDGQSNGTSLKIRVVNFKKIAEQSKLGKQEQTSFDALKKQMENVLSEKEKVLNDMATKFDDNDFLDSLSPEAETDMKRKFRNLNQEYTQLQQQYIQTLQQTNFKIVQKLSENVGKASNTVAKKLKYDLVLNDETTFFVSPDLDISSEIVKELDQIFDKEESTKNESKTEQK